MIRKENSPIADMEKVLVAWKEDQTSHNIPFSQSLIKSKAVTLLLLWRLREVRKLQKKSLKVAKVGSWNWRKEAIALAEVQDEIASADAEATARYPEDLAKIINEGVL